MIARWMAVAWLALVPVLACAQGLPSANQVYAGPASGSPAAPTFRALVTTDIPALTQTLTQFHFFIGNAGNVATDMALSGDCTYGASGIICTKTNAVAFGTAATQNTGTSGATIPLLNGSNTFSSLVNFTSTFQIGGNAITWPGAATTVAALNIADQTVTGGANVTSLSLTTGNVTIDCGARPLQFITNNGAYTITTPANDGSCMLLVTNGASAGATTFSGFSVGASTGDALTTTNTSKFTISIWRINGVSGYRVAAHQ